MVDMFPPVDALAVTLAAAGTLVTAATPQVSATALKTPRSTLDLEPCTYNRALISCAPFGCRQASTFLPKPGSMGPNPPPVLNPQTPPLQPTSSTCFRQIAAKRI